MRTSPGGYARRVSGFLVAVDYGAVNTVAVLRRPDGQVRPLLVDGSPLLPSAACVGPDGRLLVGRDAESAGRVDPAAFVPDPRSRIDAGTVLLGRSSFPVVEVIGSTLALAAREAIHSAGGVLPRLVLTHPASWDETRRARHGGGWSRPPPRPRCAGSRSCATTYVRPRRRSPASSPSVCTSRWSTRTCTSGGRRSSRPLNGCWRGPSTWLRTCSPPRVRPRMTSASCCCSAGPAGFHWSRRCCTAGSASRRRP